jgi:hypothetical protein
MYALQEPGGYELKNLVNGQCLVEVNIRDNLIYLWISIALNWKLQDVGLLIEKPIKVRKVLDKAKAPLLSYRELLQIMKAK